jgi:hypothetical protein
MNENRLTQQQIAQQDFVDNTIFSLIRFINLTNKEIEWDIEMIAKTRDVMKEWLVDKFNLTTEQEFYPYLEEWRGS